VLYYIYLKTFISYYCSAFLGALITSCDSDVDTGVCSRSPDYLSVSNKVVLVDTLTVDISTKLIWTP
jgi:hypothetical protein